MTEFGDLKEDLIDGAISRWTGLDKAKVQGLVAEWLPRIEQAGVLVDRVVSKGHQILDAAEQKIYGGTDARS